MRRLTACAVVGAVVAWGLPGGLCAEADEEDTSFFDMSLEELLSVEVAEVTTASKRAEKTTEAPGTVIVIDKHDIRLRGYATLQDVLRDLPGMETIEDYFSEIGTLVPVRGIVGNNKIILLVNGMRVNPPGGEWLPIRNDISVRHAEQIEIVYGPGSTLYGEDAIGAVINIKTATGDEQGPTEAGIAGGMYDTGEGWATFSRSLMDGKVRFLGHVRVADSHLSDIDEDYPQWWAGYEAVAAPKGRGLHPSRDDYGINVFARLETDTTSLQLWHRDSRRSSSEGFNPILGYVREARWEDQTTVVEGRHRVELSDRTDLESALTYAHYEIDPKSRYVFAANENEWFLDDYKYGVGSGAGIEETLRVTVSPTLHVLAGAVASTFEITPKATIPGGANPDHDIGAQGGQFVYFTEQGNPATRHEIRRAVTVRYDTYAAYAEGSWQASDTFKTIAGVRLTDDSRFGENPVTPRISLVWAALERLTAKYTYAEAYVAPAPYFAYAPFDNGTLLATSNPDLDPERSRSHELAFHYDLDRGHVSLSVYYGDQENLLLVADAGTSQNVVEEQVFLEDGSTRVLTQTVNGGESWNVGADLYGEMRMGNVNPWFSYSFVDYEEKSDGVELGLRGVSAHNLRLGATCALTTKLIVTPSLVLRSTPRNVTEGPLDSELDMPWEANLHVLYKVHRHMDLFTTLRNVTDNEYALAGFTGDAYPQETFRSVVGIRGEL